MDKMSEIYNDQFVYKNLINGEWISSRSGKLIRITSPVDGTLIGEVQAITKD